MRGFAASLRITRFNVRRYFGGSPVRPFLAGGLGVMWSRSLHSITQVRGPVATVSEFASKDRGFGPDLGAGLRLRVSPSWSVEADVRWLEGAWLSRENLAVTRLRAGVTYAIGRPGTRRNNP